MEVSSIINRHISPGSTRVGESVCYASSLRILIPTPQTSHLPPPTVCAHIHGYRSKKSPGGGGGGGAGYIEWAIKTYNILS